jgi:glutathione peroxidase
MRLMAFAFAVAALAATLAPADNPKDGDKAMTGALSFKMKGIDGKDVDLSTYKGKVVLFVNVASKCGYTPQYEGLQKLYSDLNKDGLVIIGVPANEFGKQEPGSNEDIVKFCQTNYKVTFPMLAKVVVKGDGICDLYKFLTSETTNPKFAGDVKWNFEKFLIGRDGSVAGRFKSGVEPGSDELVKAIKAELEKK